MANPFALHRIPKLQPESFLELAESASLDLELPLPRQRLRLGPIEREWFGAHALHLRLGIRAGLIDRSTARTRIDPPLSLPLGVGVRGLRLTDDGELVLELSGLGDFNLTRLIPLLPRIPEDPVELWRNLEGRIPRGRRTQPPAPAPAPNPPTNGEGSGRQLKMRLEALKPFPDARLDLGQAGHIALGAGTEFSVEMLGKTVSVKGRAALSGGRLAGPAMEMDGVSGATELSWDKREQSVLDMSGLELDVRSLRFLEAAPLRLDLSTAKLQVPAFRAEGLRQTVSLRLQGQLATGQDGRWGIPQQRVLIEGTLRVEEDHGVTIDALRIESGTP
ncbi:MAG: hypothetical protein AAGD10_18605 [Myxococcota bacterium]